jgi:branched-chain amino acid transport system ATP-binding protein
MQDATNPSNQPPRLLVKHVNKRFGGLQALSNVGLRIEAGQIYGLIGPNGAGKSTFFNALTGWTKPDSGTFALDGYPYQPNQIGAVAKAGIARTFQNLRLFDALTVLENIMVGRHARTREGLIGAIFRTRRQRQEERAIRDYAFALLDYVGLASYANAPAGSLSYGHQRRLEIARALASEPRLLALDEPAAGMNPAEKIELQTLLRTICSAQNGLDFGKLSSSGEKNHIAILLIEHDVQFVTELCDEITVLDSSRKALLRHCSEILK